MATVGQVVPVDLAGDVEEHLLEQVDAGLGRVHLGHRVTGAPGGGAEPVEERGGRLVVGRHHELDRRPASVHVAVQVLAVEERHVLVDRDHDAGSGERQAGVDLGLARPGHRREHTAAPGQGARRQAHAPAVLGVDHAALVEQVEVPGELLAGVVAGRAGEQGEDLVDVDELGRRPGPQPLGRRPRSRTPRPGSR